MSDPSVTLIKFIRTFSQHLSELVLEEHFLRYPQYQEKCDMLVREKYFQDTNYSLKYLIQALEAKSPILFAEYIRWLRTLITSLNIPPAHLTEHLTCLISVLKTETPAGLNDELTPFLDVIMPSAMESYPAEESYIQVTDAWSKQAQLYLDNLNRGLRVEAIRQVMSLADGKESIKNIYLRILQPVQREIGRLWHTNKITVAHEHYSTGVTQQIMSQLYPYIFNSDVKDKRFVATCVQGELHEIGLRMVTDMMELDGWDTWFLGANLPTESLIKLLIDKQADILAVSSTMTFHLGDVDKIICAVRKEDKLKNLKVLVGGYPFLLDADLWKAIGADGYARDASEAVTVADKLFSGHKV